jgi:hypothetical protein
MHITTVENLVSLAIWATALKSEGPYVRYISIHMSPVRQRNYYAFAWCTGCKAPIRIVAHRQRWVSKSVNQIIRKKLMQMPQIHVKNQGHTCLFLANQARPYSRGSHCVWEDAWTTMKNSSDQVCLDLISSFSLGLYYLSATVLLWVAVPLCNPQIKCPVILSIQDQQARSAPLLPQIGKRVFLRVPQVDFFIFDNKKLLLTMYYCARRLIRKILSASCIVICINAIF